MFYRHCLKKYRIYAKKEIIMQSQAEKSVKVGHQKN